MPFILREGTTDSEAIFLAIVGANIEENTVRATETVMHKLKHVMTENGGGHRLRFTAALTNGRDIYAAMRSMTAQIRFTTSATGVAP